MKVIGLLGKKGSGKGTVAEALVGIGYKEIAFADPLYEEAAEAFNVSVESLKVRETKETPLSALKLTLCKDAKFFGIAHQWCVEALRPGSGQGGFMVSPLDGHFYLSPRVLLQLWGTEHRRKDDNLYWVKALHERVKQLSQEAGQGIVISDVREAMEAAYVKRRDNGSVWKIIRPNNPYEGVGTGQHSSETQVDTIAYDHILCNKGSITDLKKAAVDLEEKIELFGK